MSVQEPQQRMRAVSADGTFSQETFLLILALVRQVNTQDATIAALTARVETLETS